MRYGELKQKQKEIKQAILILSPGELSLIIVACEEYSKNHPQLKKIKETLKELEDVAVF